MHVPCWCCAGGVRKQYWTISLTSGRYISPSCCQDHIGMQTKTQTLPENAAHDHEKGANLPGCSRQGLWLRRKTSSYSEIAAAPSKCLAINRNHDDPPCVRCNIRHAFVGEWEDKENRQPCEPYQPTQCAYHHHDCHHQSHRRRPTSQHESTMMLLLITIINIINITSIVIPTVILFL